MRTDLVIIVWLSIITLYLVIRVIAHRLGKQDCCRGLLRGGVIYKGFCKNSDAHRWNHNQDFDVDINTGKAKCLSCGNIQQLKGATLPTGRSGVKCRYWILDGEERYNFIPIDSLIEGKNGTTHYVKNENLDIDAFNNNQ